MPEQIRYRELYRMLGEHRLFQSASLGEFIREYSCLRDQDKLEARYTRQIILDIFGVKNVGDINPENFTVEEIQDLQERVINLWCGMYGVEGETSDKLRKILEAMKDADSVVKMIEDPRFGVFRSIHTEISAVNEVILENNPVQLLCMLLSDKYSERAKFEARRKLILADLALAIHKRIDGEVCLVKKFTDFLNQNIISGPIGQTHPVEVFSTHSPVDYSCVSVKVLEEEEKVSTSEFKLFHKLKMRKWSDRRGNEHFVQIDQRVKDIGAFIIKILRKDEKSAGVVDDPLGFKLVFLTKKDISEFLTKLQQVAVKQGFFIKYVDPYDTVANNEDFRVTNPGSNSKLEIVKVHFNFHGSLIELQLHTLRSHLDSRIADGKGHEEFSLVRLISEGKWDESVMDLLYPVDIYGWGWKDAWPELIADIRESNRHRSALLPVDRSTFSEKETRYSDHFLAADIAALLEKLAYGNGVKIPDIIVVPGRNELFGASELSLAFGGVKILIAAQHTQDEIRSQTIGKQVIIFDDVADKCRNIRTLKDLIPTATVVTLIAKGEEIPSVVDHTARKMPVHQRVRFFWERGRLDEGYRPPVHAVVLPVRTIAGKTQYLCQSVISNSRGGKYVYKLIGGAKDLTDQNLHATIQREIQEEVVGLPTDSLRMISENGYKYSKEGAIYSTGFIRVYTIPVSDADIQNISSIDPEVNNLCWVTQEELCENLHPMEYAAFLEQWCSSVFQ